MASLLRTEADERGRLLRVVDTKLSLDLTSDADFGSRSEISFEASRDADSWADLDGILIAAELNGEPVNAPLVERRLPLRVRQGRNRLVVEARMAYSSDGEGLHRHIDPADARTYLYAMSFLDAAPRWFACFDQPDLKSPYTIEVLAPAGWLVRGNGAATRVSVDDGDASGGAVARWRLAATRPLSTYFVTLVAGPWAEIREEHDGIPLGLYARQALATELAREADDILEVTRQAFDRYHELFGVRYPFGEYNQVFAPDFNAGAMENPGCVVLRDQYIYRGAATRAERASRAGTIVHEMAHQWFGDLVTMRWWDDLWLNESFAEYMGHRICAEATRYELWTEYGIVRKDWGFVADQAPSSHPVAANPAPDAAAAIANFDGISYAKGATVLRQLVGLIGEDAFLAGLCDYFERFAYGNAEMGDLLAAWQRAGAPALGGWSEQWLRSPGMDLLRAEIADGRAVVVRESDAPRTHAIEVALLDPDGRRRERRPVVVEAERTPVGIEAPPGTIVIPDAGDVGWARVRFNTWQLPVVSAIEDAATRVVVHNAIRDAVRSAELAPDQALRMIEAAMPGETGDIVVASVLRFAVRSLCGAYCPVELRAGRRLRVATLADRLLTAADAGSDRQLVALRAFISVTDDASRLDRWLAGHDLPPGRRLDADLRWQVVERLVTLGADPGLIDRELRRDDSSQGRLAAARARAGVPERRAKDAAFALLTRPSDAGNNELYATAEQFFLPEQAELTAGHVADYFRLMPATAAFRQGWMLGRVASLAYPVVAASPEVLALAEQTLARDDLDPQVRRSLVDGTDQLRRAVASLRAFAT